MRRAAVAGVGVLGVIVVFLGRDRPAGDLLAGASRVGGTAGLVTNETTYSGYRYFYYHVPSFFWVGNGRLLSVRELDRGRYETDRIDPVTAEVRREPGFGDFAVDEADGRRVFYWSVSPDGRWGVSVRVVGEDLVYRARRLDGGPALRVWTNRQEVAVDLRWVSDSSGFAEWPSRPDGVWARFHWLESGEVEEHRLRDLAVESTAGMGRLGAVHVAVGTRAGLEEGEGEVLVAEGGRDGGPRRWSRRRFEVPRRFRGLEYKLVPSPEGDRVAWICYFRRWLPQVHWRPRFPFVSTEPRFLTGVFVSRVDGTGLTSLGMLPPGEEINRLSWTPEGSHISFVVREGVWKVPVRE